MPVLEPHPPAPLARYVHGTRGGTWPATRYIAAAQLYGYYSARCRQSRRRAGLEVHPPARCPGPQSHGPALTRPERWSQSQRQLQPVPCSSRSLHDREDLPRLAFPSPPPFTIPPPGPLAALPLPPIVDYWVLLEHLSYSVSGLLLSRLLQYLFGRRPVGALAEPPLLLLLPLPASCISRPFIDFHGPDSPPFTATDNVTTCLPSQRPLLRDSSEFLVSPQPPLPLSLGPTVIEPNSHSRLPTRPPHD